MKITPFSIVPPKGTENNPQVTPELQAAVSARYSRSGDGLQVIMSKVDLNDPEKSIDRIMKFVDYGHFSIAGLTGTVGVALDGISSYLAHRIFDFAQMADGQQTSTRYVTMDETSLMDPSELGFPPELADKVRTVWKKCIATYLREYNRIDQLANEKPEIVRYPEGSSELKRNRIRKNFALDQTRGYLPMGLRTNVIIVATAATWSHVLSGLLSCPEKEARDAANAVIEKLTPYFPNLIRYAKVKDGWKFALRDEAWEGARRSTLNINAIPDETLASAALPPGCSHDVLTLERGMNHRSERYGRYDRFGADIRLTPVSVRWNGMAIAQLRDLIRHRTGRRYSPLSHEGFYLPETVERDRELLIEVTDLIAEIRKVMGDDSGMHAYALLFGSQTYFTHTTTLDNFIYEAELRTDAGADIRYAKHLRDAVDAVKLVIPHVDNYIKLGVAEPE